MTEHEKAHMQRELDRISRVAIRQLIERQRREERQETADEIRAAIQTIVFGMHEGEI